MHVTMRYIIVPCMGMDEYSECIPRKYMRGIVLNAQKCVVKLETIYAYERKWYMWRIGWLPKGT